MIQLRPDFEAKFSGFHDLMQKRVREILLVSSLYDAFVLEEDGRLAEKIFSEYIDLNLHFIPRITKVSTAEEALKALKEGAFDLVITMARISDMDPIEFGRRVKEYDSAKPVVLLTYDVIQPGLLRKLRKTGYIDKIFYWSGESKLLLTIIKYVEDKQNAPADVQTGVQVILIIEDTPKYYSLFLPIIYAEIMTQTRKLIHDGVNDLHRMLRMRARPKILLAETFEEAVQIYQKYKHNLLGIISDIRFPFEGKLDENAGFKLAGMIRSEVPDLPILLQSSKQIDLREVNSIGAAFVDKNSPHLLAELRNFMLREFGFSDFIFRDSHGVEITRAKDLVEFLKIIQTIPPESLRYHAQKNHFSIWLRARTEFEAAEILRPQKVSDYQDIEDIRRAIVETIQNLLHQLEFGIIKDFAESQTYFSSSFARIGSGSIGGKGRGIAFINTLLANTSIFDRFRDIEIKTPQTFVLGSEVFEDFIEHNDLMQFALSHDQPSELAKVFKKKHFPEKIKDDLLLLLQKLSYPIAIRSSSILEDSQNLPFAGLYKTYMLPNNHPNIKVRLRQLMDAIKYVYASVFFRNPKQYVKNTDYRIEEEKMAVLVQQMAGRKFGDVFYPVISGVAQSYNFYPISHMEPQDGIVHLALGLGKTIVEGENIYRFSPAYPQMNLPYNSPSDFLNKSQKKFYALNLKDPAIKVGTDENFSLKHEDIQRAETDGSLFFVGSTFSPQDQTIQDTLSIKGPRVISFANILKYKIFPLAEILQNFLKLGQDGFGSHIEIEFAINLCRKAEVKPEFYILQIRPMVAGRENHVERIRKNDFNTAFCRTDLAVGNGKMTDIADLVYVSPALFDSSHSKTIARELETINQKLEAENRSYILIGFGRWGTTDSSLGIPVQWHQISNVKVLVESNLNHFKIDPSLGSHFFHNLISLRLGYFHVKGTSKEEFINWDWLQAQPVHYQTKFVKHVRGNAPFTVKIDGHHHQGVILKPENS